MKILVIGSKGFIGQHVVDHFSSKGHLVFEADVIVDYNREHYFLIDAGRPDFSDLFMTHQFDVCINCSGAASVQDSIQNPSRDFLLNVSNVFFQLDAIRRFNPNCKYIHFSSAAVYGNPNVLPIAENVGLKPISPYGCHKKMAEEICQEFSAYYNVPSVSLRVFSAYGPGLKKQLFWDLYKKAQTDQTIQLHGTGKESRDFIDIKDLVELLEIIISKASFEGESYNAASGCEISIEEAVETFYGFFEEKKYFEFNGVVRKGDPKNWRADISKVREMGYSPQSTIATGLKQYYKWARENV